MSVSGKNVSDDAYLSILTRAIVNINSNNLSNIQIKTSKAPTNP